MYISLPIYYLYHVSTPLFIFYLGYLVRALTHKVPVQFARIASIKLELRVSRGSQMFQECWPRGYAAHGGGLLLVMDRCRLMMVGVRAYICGNWRSSAVCCRR